MVNRFIGSNGTYLIESFAQGGNQHDAINLSNARYSDLRGQDKVLLQPHDNLNKTRNTIEKHNS